VKIKPQWVVTPGKQTTNKLAKRILKQVSGFSKLD
jgi:hypothetical protein